MIKLKSRISMAKQFSTSIRQFSPKHWTSKALHLEYCAETWKLWPVNQKYLEGFEMWYWRRMEKITWTDRVRK
jgi:hypothetical protein